MSSPEPPADQTPPPPQYSATPPPPPPPPPAGQYGAPAPGYGAPPAPAGVPRPGELLDRFVARLLDLIIVGIPVGIVNFILSAASDSWLLANLITSVVSAVAYLGYFGYLESSRGATLGKQVMKLQVVGPDGHSNPTMEQAVRRNLWTGLAILQIVPILGLLVGFLLYVVSVILIVIGINTLPDRRTWFDKLAGGTQVLKVG